VRLFVGFLILALVVPAAAKKGKKGPPRQASSYKDFTYLLPKGYRNITEQEGAAAAWTHTPTGTLVTMTRLSAKQAREWYKGKAYTAATKTRAALNPEKNKNKVFSKVYKKTLSSGLKYYFFSYRDRKSRSPLQKAVGFMKMGENLYRIEGKVTVRPDGMETLYWILGTIKPIKQPKRKRAFKPGAKPALLQGQEEKERGVPLY